MSNPQKHSLPEGYWMRQIAGAWYLFNPWDVLVAGPADAAVVQRYAWCDVWRRIDQELHAEFAAFQDDARPLQELPRLRQFFRAMDAAPIVGFEVKGRSNQARRSGPRLSTVVASVAIAASIATAAFVIAALGIGPGTRRPTVRTLEHEYAVSAPVAMRKLPVPGPHRANGTGVVRSSVIVRTPAARTPVHPPARATYVVVVGKFETPAAAEQLKRLVQRKGYVVHVVPHGAFSEVMTPRLRTRTQAEYVARGLEAVGLQAELVALQEQ